MHGMIVISEIDSGKYDEIATLAWTKATFCRWHLWETLASKLMADSAKASDGSGFLTSNNSNYANL
ncbi:hypothetical protein FOXYSP1_05826 [Fusarium oxysporum f. sp. phaseoli]|jgi:hypothetical protein